MDEPIAAAAAEISAADIFRDARRLGDAENADTKGLDVQMATCDAIEGVGLLAIPAAHVEATRHDLLLAIEMAQQRHQLVTLDQDSGGVADQQLADRLVSRVIRSKADRQRLPSRSASRSAVLPFFSAAASSCALTFCRSLKAFRFAL